MEFTETKPDIENAFERLKIDKNSKGYNWGIRIVKQDNQTDIEMLDRLEKLNGEMMQRFGSLE